MQSQMRIINFLTSRVLSPSQIRAILSEIILNLLKSIENITSIIYDIILVSLDTLQNMFS